MIKEKRDGSIKGRTCADGSKQRKYLSEFESVAFPTLSLEALILMLLIDIFEGRDVAIFDIPGAYLHALLPNEKTMIFKLRDYFVDIMCEINPEYKQYVWYEKSKKIQTYFLFVFSLLKMSVR